MRVAFYAPLKPPDHPTPSGDRRVARLFIEALRRKGHEVAVASRLRSRVADGDAARQDRLRRLGQSLAHRYVGKATSQSGARPHLWLTYHLYYKAPDWLGPAVTRALDIPYVIAEASHAPKRAGGPWAIGHEAVEAALRHADLVLGLNPIDSACVQPVLRRGVELIGLAPFLNPAPYDAAHARRDEHRAAIAARLDLDPTRPWLLAVGMMRDGDKDASYRVLAEAVAMLDDLDWHLVVVGDGPRRSAVEIMLRRAAGDRVRFAGTQALDDLPAFYAAADLMVWPAINEAFGMALLEAQATGLPVIAGASGGVGTIVEHGVTGYLAPPGNAAAFADAVRPALASAGRRATMSAAARAKVARVHHIDRAAERIDRLLRALVAERTP